MDTYLQDPSYLLSTVQVIAESHHERSSIHNILDAYATFVNRLKSQSQILQACDTLPPAFTPLIAFKDNFLRALRRDVGLAHIDPFSCPCCSLDDTTVHLNIKIDAKQYAMDSSLLCNHALCTATTIFRFPAFHFAFTEHDLSSLFGDVLDIALADQLPVLNEAKTYSLSLWALGCHRLPLSVLEPRRDDLFSALRRSLDGARQPTNIVLDGLKAISYTIERHRAPFFDLLSPPLPRVVTNLNHECAEHRLQASFALGQFANALIHQPGLTLTKWQSLSDHVISFLQASCEESPIAPYDTSFSRMVRSAFAAESHARRTDGPAWILALLASLIVLCGPTLYRKPSVLHIILQSLGMALTHKRSIVRALHPHVWRCLVWIFSRMLSGSESVDPALISSALHVIKQEVGGGIGVALASVLLSEQASVTGSDERGDRISQALSVIKAMVRTDCKHTRREGLMFLQALTNNAQARHQILHSICEIPASVLLNGAVIRAEWDNLPAIIRSIPQVPVYVHWPEETEIARHFKTFLVIWEHSTKANRKHLDSDLVDVWLSILLAYSSWFERKQDITGRMEMLKYTAAIIVEFLPSLASADSQPDWGSWNVHDQLSSLTCIDQLWSAVRKAFVIPSLVDAAELILASILKYGFHILDPGVGDLWSRLCADLMTVAPPSFLRDVHDPTTPRLVIRSQRELWGVVATSLPPSDSGLDWKELIKFLAVPICAWVLSEPEVKVWEALLRAAIAVSGDPTQVTEHIVSQYFEGKGAETWDSILIVLGFLLTHTQEHGNYPSDELLSMVDACLTVSYNRADRSREALTQSLTLLSIIRDMIASTPGNVLYILQALRISLCLWIEDHTEVMSNEEFNSEAVSLYCEALKALEVLPLSMQSLQDTEDFIASAFSRIPTPAIAPFAFERFWRATYHGRSQLYGDLPPKIKSCLVCFVAAYGGDLADGLSLTSQSQSQSIGQFPSGRQYQDAGEFGLRDELSTPVHADTWTDAEAEAALYECQHAFVGRDDTAFLKPSSDDAPQSTVLRQLQEYTSQIYASSQDSSERSANSLQMLLPPIFPLDGAIPRSRSHSPENIRLVTFHARNQKRKLAHDDGALPKRSRTSRGILRTVRKLESEPATRDVTPVDVPRMSSVPLQKRKLFDGVEVLAFRQILRRQRVQRVERINDALQTASPHSARSRTSQFVLPPSNDDMKRENLRVDETSSEADVDRSLADAYPSSPPRSGPHDIPASSLKATPRTEGSPSAHLSLQRVKATVSRLEALRDVYSSVENGASQIPFDELLQATELVHKIGAVLTKQVGKRVNKKMDNKIDDPR